MIDSETAPRRSYPARAYYQEQHVADGYDAARFQSPVGRLRAALDRRALQRCLEEVPAGSPVLDIACGTGRVTALLARQGFSVVGADISLAMLLTSRRRLLAEGLRSPLAVADAEKLPFREACFRAATAVRLLGNLPREVRVGVLRAAGEVADLVIVDYTVRTPAGDLRRRLFPHGVGGERLAGYPWAVLTQADLARELEAAQLIVRRHVPALPVLSDSVFYVLERH